MKNTIIIRFLKLGIITLILGCVTTAQAQRASIPAQVFLNQYLSNAALAGADSSLNINLSYNRQYDDFIGAPVVSLISADYLVGKRVGLGLNVMNQKAGLLNQTRVALSYAYHLPVGADGQTLHFGISAAVENNSLPIEDVDGDQNDPSLTNYNSRGAYMDGDFGLAYTGKGLSIQAAVPTMRSYLIKDEYGSVNRATFYTSASYKIGLGEEVNSIEPKVCYTTVKGNEDLWDFGLDFKCANNLANIQAIYHSTQSFTVGLGVDVLSRVKVLAFYTSETKALKSYTDGNLSLNLKIALFKH
ncbi:hypothetical protein C3K47_16745 [Solitalea longa]|uniref:Type IX secretion system membrane protein PorP/SprF n=1 Tax=Solitalea longa TaxID=2079460 RepID=A0A2S4ZYP2_9SPHI|nr:PorP/SprF family type IX secretion system membrane protein [Solitalea longa]POY35052.1 hypothetical protein C3K47_16745 [Solitalea longa]